MAKIYYDKDANLSLIRGKKVAIIGYGSQGHAPEPHRRQDADVRPRLQHPLQGHCPAEERRRDDGRAEGPRPPRARGLPGGRRRPRLIAVHQDATGHAKPTSRCPTPRHRLHPRRRPRDDLHRGDRDRPCSASRPSSAAASRALVKAGFKTLVDAGYQPEIAYFECMHELKLIVDLMYRGGLNYMRYSVSDTAEYGDYVSGPRVVTKKTQAEMKRILKDITTGKFAKRFIDENNKHGRKTMTKFRNRERGQKIEVVGAKLRAMMPFLNAT
jgi:ketol-acid reductoisomerase